MNRKDIMMAAALVLLAASRVGAQSTFRHPGLLHSGEDFAHIRERVAAGDAHTLEALDVLKASPPVYGDHGHNWGVNEVIKRGIQGDENYMNAYRNAARAYQLALLWRITGDTGYANAAIDVLDAYRIWNKGLGGNTNMSLIPGFIGYQFINAAEIMREYEGWPQENFELFKQYMIDVWFTLAQDFLERRHDTVWRESNWYHYHSNWGLGNALFCVSLGIMCDLPDIYNYGMYWLKEGPGNESLCVTSLHPDAFGQGLCGYGWGLIPWFHKDDRGPLGYFCQMQESGRDQGHAMAALGLLSYAFQSAYNQGDNAFCNLYNSKVDGQAGTAMVAGAAEYVAAYNSGVDDLPYTQNWWMGGLNATGRGQWRPIWQLLINHYQNRMGIKMPYCEAMHNIIGIERGGGSYGNNSGGYDHTGFGDLMHYDTPVAADKIPTILQPTITSTAGVRHYAEISGVEPGTQLTLAASLPGDETDTGQWTWEDGATGRERTVSATAPALYRLTYTNSQGVQSTQLFSIAVRGQGVQATLSCSYTYMGQTQTGNEVLVGKGRSVTLNTSYANWNYIESEEWFDENGISVSTGGSYTYTLNDEQDHVFTFRLTNQSGVVMERQFTVRYNPNDYSRLLGDPDCASLDAWQHSLEGFQLQENTICGMTLPFIERWRPSSQDGADTWGTDRFRLWRQATGLPTGKFRLSALAVAAQQTYSLGDARAAQQVDHVYLFADSVCTPVRTGHTAERFEVVCYVGDGGTLDFGLKNLADQDHAYSAWGANWVALDDLYLTYEGTATLADDLEAMRTEAAAYTADQLPQTVYNRLQALSALTTQDVAAAVELQRVLADARVMREHYDDYAADCLRYATFLEEQGIVCEPLSTAIEAFRAATCASTLVKAWQTMRQAWLDCIYTASVPVPLTADLKGSTPSQASTEWFDASLKWRTDASGGNMRVLPIDGSGAERGMATGTYMVERYCTANFTAGERLLYMVASGMPVGEYVLTAAVQKGAEGGVIKLFVNDTEVNVGSVTSLKRYRAAAQVTDGVLTLGLKSADGNACRWTSMADVEVQYLSPLAMVNSVLDEYGELEDYTTGDDKTLDAAVQQAQGVQAEGTDAERMAAATALRQAVYAYRVSHPMSQLIETFDFNNGTFSGWTSNYEAPGAESGVLEFWNNRQFDFWREVTDLDNGWYRISMNGFYRGLPRQSSDKADYEQSVAQFSGYSNGCYYNRPVCSVYSEDCSALGSTMSDDGAYPMWRSEADAAFKAGKYHNQVDVLVEEGTIIYALRCTDFVQDAWMCFDNITLTYRGQDYYSMYADMAATARADAASLPQAWQDHLEAVIAANEVIEGTPLDEAAPGIKALQQAMDVTHALLALQRQASVQRQALVTELSHSYADSKEALNQAVATADAALQQALTTQEMTDALQAQEEARQTYVASARPHTGYDFSLTHLLADADCADASTRHWLRNGSASGYVESISVFNSDLYKGSGISYWNGSAETNTDMVYQDITVSRPGIYRLTALACAAQWGSGNTNNGNRGGTRLRIGPDMVDVTASTYAAYSVQTEVTASQLEADGTCTLRVGLYAGGSNANTWAMISHVQLELVGYDMVEAAETYTDLPWQDGLTRNVTLQRNLKTDGSWNTLCLPFGMSAAQLKANHIVEVRRLTEATTTAGSTLLTFEECDALEAGVPYIVKAEAGAGSIELGGVTCTAATPGAVQLPDGLTMAGNYAQTYVPQGAYFISSNAFYLADQANAVGLKGYRAYITVPSGVAPGCNVLFIDLDDLPTTLGSQPVAATTHTSVYSLTGVLLRHHVACGTALQGLPAGLYVVGGKVVRHGVR